MEGNPFMFWVSHNLKCLSFRTQTGYERMEAHSLEEMWSRVHQFVNDGYRVC